MRVNNLKIERKNFYECGFKPSIQRPLQMSLQFYMISILFILFDTDLLFLYPLVSGFTFFFLTDLFILIFILFTLYISIIYEKINFSFFWKFFMLQLLFFVNFLFLNNTNFQLIYFVIIFFIISYTIFNVNVILVFRTTLQTIFFKNSNFIKESFFIDFLQKKLIDNFFKKSLIISTQIFNLNFFSTTVIKYIYLIFINNYNFFQKTNNLNIINVLLKLIILFYFIFILIIDIIILI